MTTNSTALICQPQDPLKVLLWRMRCAPYTVNWRQYQLLLIAREIMIPTKDLELWEEMTNKNQR